MRLENTMAQVRAEMEKVATENKELHLKMDIIMEENNRYNNNYNNNTASDRVLTTSTHAG